MGPFLATALPYLNLIHLSSVTEDDSIAMDEFIPRECVILLLLPRLSRYSESAPAVFYCICQTPLYRGQTCLCVFIYCPYSGSLATSRQSTQVKDLTEPNSYFGISTVWWHHGRCKWLSCWLHHLANSPVGYSRVLSQAYGAWRAVPGGSVRWDGSVFLGLSDRL